MGEAKAAGIAGLTLQMTQRGTRVQKNLGFVGGAPGSLAATSQKPEMARPHPGQQAASPLLRSVVEATVPECPITWVLGPL